MPLPDDLVTKVAAGSGGVLGLRWLWQIWRSSRSDVRSDQTESQALKNLKAEVERLAARVERLETEVGSKEEENKLLQDQLDEQRKLRRKAEDELDTERRERANLENRIVDLERRKP